MDGFDSFVVVVNTDDQYSLWPAEVAVPGGWLVVFGPSDRGACLDWVERTWTDMRPKSVRDAAMDRNG